MRFDWPANQKPAWLIDLVGSRKYSVVLQSQNIADEFLNSLAQDTQETELGFIFSIMKDFNLPDYLTNPLTRVDWWDFWFSKCTTPLLFRSK